MQFLPKADIDNLRGRFHFASISSILHFSSNKTQKEIWEALSKQNTYVICLMQIDLSQRKLKKYHSSTLIFLQTNHQTHLVHILPIILMIAHLRPHMTSISAHVTLLYSHFYFHRAYSTSHTNLYSNPKFHQSCYPSNC